MVDGPQVLSRVQGQATVYQQVGRWESGLLESHRIQRVGSLMRNDDLWVEAFWEDVDLDVRGAEYVELLVRTELENAEHLRAWFL